MMKENTKTRCSFWRVYIYFSSKRKKNRKRKMV